MHAWINVAPVHAFGPGQSRLVDVDEARIAVFNLDGAYFAIEDVCTHDGSPLLGSGLDARDLVDGDQIICPRHGARFCIRTGAVLAPPAYEPIARFAVRIDAGIVQVCPERIESG